MIAPTPDPPPPTTTLPPPDPGVSDRTTPESILTAATRAARAKLPPWDAADEHIRLMAGIMARIGAQVALDAARSDPMTVQDAAQDRRQAREDRWRAAEIASVRLSGMDMRWSTVAEAREVEAYLRGESR
jgi:hypothetical protein